MKTFHLFLSNLCFMVATTQTGAAQTIWIASGFVALAGFGFGLTVDVYDLLTERRRK